jgi:hypothetical protein
MKIRSTVGLILTLGLLHGTIVRAGPPPSVQAEVNSLLAQIDKSSCQFYRNGTWYDSAAAQAHLRDKYDYLVQRNLIDTTEQFIERAATKSSFSGKEYLVKCNDGVAVKSSQWLRDELARLRSH